MKIEPGPTEGMVTIDGVPWARIVARQAAVCYATKEPIVPGSLVYRPMRSTAYRYRRILASFIEGKNDAS